MLILNIVFKSVMSAFMRVAVLIEDGKLATGNINSIGVVNRFTNLPTSRNKKECVFSFGLFLYCFQ